MKVKNISLARKYIITVAFISVAASVFYFYIHLQKDTPSENYESVVPSSIIDSVFSEMSQSEKVGLLFFIHTEVKDSSDFNSLLNTAKRFNISSWLPEIISFDSHAQISDTLQKITGIPLTYAIQWDGFHDENLELPPLSALASISDPEFTEKFAQRFSDMTSTYGINSIFIPHLNFYKTEGGFSQYYFNNLISAIEILFNNNVFQSSNIIFQFSSKTNVENNNPAPFANKLFGIYYKNTGFSSISDSNFVSPSCSFAMMPCESENDLLRFLYSSSNMLYIDMSRIEPLHNSLSELYRNKNYRAILDKKIKQIIEVKLLQKFQQLCHPSKPLNAESTLWKTCLLQLSEHTSCLIQNRDNLFPLIDMNARFIVSENCKVPEFHKTMKSFFPDYKYEVIKSNKTSTIKVISEHRNIRQPLIFIQNPDHLQFDTVQLDSLSEKLHLALIDFSFHPDHKIKYFKSYVKLYGSSVWYQRTAAGLINGSTNVSGNFFTFRADTPVLQSLQIPLIRLKHSYPEDAGLDGNYLHNTIDSLIMDAMIKGAFPGCQIFAARNGKIIFNKTYGYHTYERTQSVMNTDLYDIASVTKIAATTIAAMRMCDQGRLRLDETMKKYFRNSEINYSRIKTDTNVVIDTFNLRIFSLENLIRENKIYGDTFRLNDTLLVVIDTVFSKATPYLNIFNVPIRFMLMHYSGISPTLPILPYIQIKRYFLKDNGITEEDAAKMDISWKEVWELYYSNKKTDSSSVQVARGMYLKNRWLDTLWQRTKETGVSGRKYSQYTDLNMILVQLTMDTINKNTLDKYLQKEIFGPLGLKNIRYKPLEYGIPENRIVPTEFDKGWRKQLIRGTVHDPSAAMLGGISGNAGLFACAGDLGILFQMILNGGMYGGKLYVSENIIRLFTTTNPETGRGLGFDKYSPNNIIAPSASVNSYGHTGFTGCCLWVDPDSKLVFVFLSNRVHPDANNQLINGLKIRQKVHQVFYDAEKSNLN